MPTSEGGRVGEHADGGEGPSLRPAHTRCSGDAGCLPRFTPPGLFPALTAPRASKHPVRKPNADRSPRC